MPKNVDKPKCSINNATSNLVHFENKNILSCFVKRSRLPTTKLCVVVVNSEIVGLAPGFTGLELSMATLTFRCPLELMGLINVRTFALKNAVVLL
jgi:hypothetical protein